MDRGSYAAASAGMLHLTKIDLVNNNLANLSTPGFKGQYLTSRQTEFGDTLASTISARSPYAEGDQERTPGVTGIGTVTDFSVGPIENTAQPLHAALRKENEFFVINGPDGPLYTRAGNFVLNESGKLSTPDGLTVSSGNGEITVNQGIPEITSGGLIQIRGLPGGLSQVGGRLQVVKFDDPSILERVGANRFKVRGADAQQGQVVNNPSIVPKSLERANISAVQAIVELISASRGFELYAKSAQSIDTMNQTAIQRLGSRSA
ncbi:MAG: flagellar hook-basal body protein [Bdellovibrionales bacterium]|nr:flagellar hook-basal body protein [Bdellovibrionales bacterium]